MQPSIPRIVSSALVLGLAGPAPAGATVYTVPSPGTPTIASAFALATGDDLVEVLPGTYAEHDLNVTCSIRGTGGADQTIVDAERLGQVFRLTSGSDLSIEGLTLRNGLGDAGGAIEQQSPQNLVVRDCVFEANEAAFGGAIYTVDFTDYPVQVIGVRFEGNQASFGGGAIFAQRKAWTIDSCEFRGNHANSGGAIEFSLSVVGSQVTDCVFDGNSAGQDGGAIRANIAVVDVERCTFHGTGGSSTLAMISSTLTVNACVIAGNVGDPLSCGNGSPIVSCCDVWGNAAGDTFCGTDGGGNFSTDPRFCDAAAGDLQLLPDSPCLDGQHPDGAACGTIGALGPCPGTGVGDGVVTDGWSRVKSRYR